MFPEEIIETDEKILHEADEIILTDEVVKSTEKILRDEVVEVEKKILPSRIIDADEKIPREKRTEVAPPVKMQIITQKGIKLFYLKTLFKSSCCISQSVEVNRKC